MDLNNYLYDDHEIEISEEISESWAQERDQENTSPRNEYEGNEEIIETGDLHFPSYATQGDDFNVELFLKHLCNYPQLYKLSNAGYSDRLLKERAWENISTSMGVSVEFCKSKWKSLREKYNREKKKEESQNRSGAAANFAVPWEYMSYFKYMFDNSKPRATTSSDINISSKQLPKSQAQPLSSHSGGRKTLLQNSNKPSKIEQPNKLKQVQTEAGAERLPFVINTPQRPQKRKAMETPDQGLELLKQISTSIENVSRGEDPMFNDKIDCYTKYLAAEIRDLPLAVQQEFMDATLINLLTLKRKHNKRPNTNVG